jgi:GNAT superfamily N-acetyltransferase
MTVSRRAVDDGSFGRMAAGGERHGPSDREADRNQSSRGGTRGENLNVGSIKVRPVSAGEMDVVCQVIGLAFADNPSTLATVRGDRAKARRTMEQAMHVVKLGARYSHVLVAEHEGRLVGVLNAAEWPRCQMGAWERLKTAPAMLRGRGLALPRASKMMSARAQHDPRVPHWHIGPIGVHPRHQGRGVGKALLGRFLDLVDEQGPPAFLETDVDKRRAPPAVRVHRDRSTGHHRHQHPLHVARPTTSHSGRYPQLTIRLGTRDRLMAVTSPQRQAPTPGRRTDHPPANSRNTPTATLPSLMVARWRRTGRCSE